MIKLLINNKIKKQNIKKQSETIKKPIKKTFSFKDHLNLLISTNFV